MRTIATESTDSVRQEGTGRAFRLLMLGSSVSLLGSRITTIAYPMLALLMTGSPLAAGGVAFAATAPSLLIYLPAGVLVDQIDPRKAMLLSEAGRGAAITAVVATRELGLLNIPLLIAMAVIEEILEVFSALAEPRYVRSMVEPGESSSALARIEARKHVAIMAGRPLGGFLFGVRPILPFVADALSFVFSAWTIIQAGSWKLAEVWKPVISRLGKRRHGLQLKNDVSNGFKWLLQRRYVRSAIVSSAITTLISQALIIVFLAEAHIRHLPSFLVGIALAASGVGGALGTIALKPIAARLSAMTTVVSLIQIQMIAWGVAFFMLVVFGSRSFWCIAFVMVVLGFTGALGNIEVESYIIQNADENMLARITSINRELTFVACAIGPLLGGFLTQEYGTRFAVFTLFVITSLLAVYSLFSPSMRDRETVISAARQGDLVDDRRAPVLRGGDG
jgi:predicted MFS family arabinose efflux permease